MYILVTGASGLIGRAAVQELLRRGHEVQTLQRGPGSEIGEVRHLRTSVTSLSARRAAARVDAVLHLAGRGDVLESWSAPASYMQLIVGGTLNLLAGVRAGRGRLVFPSTQRVYLPARHRLRETDPLQPNDPYALAKRTAEEACRLIAERESLATCAIRLFSVYGPGQKGQGNSGVVAIFARRALAGEPLVVEPGPRRDFTYVDDAARGLCLALEHATAGHQVYNVATGQGTSLEKLAHLVVETFESASSVEVRAGDWPGGDLIADISRAQQLLAYRPSVSLRAGLGRVRDALRLPDA